MTAPRPTETAQTAATRGATAAAASGTGAVPAATRAAGAREPAGAPEATATERAYGINFWLPSLIQQSGVRSLLAIGWITALSYLASAVLAVLVARRAERRNEKRWHAACAAALGVASLALSAPFGQSTALTVALLTLASPGAGIAILGGCMIVAGGLIAAACKDYGVQASRSSPHGR